MVLQEDVHETVGPVAAERPCSAGYGNKKATRFRVAVVLWLACRSLRIVRPATGITRFNIQKNKRSGLAW